MHTASFEYHRAGSIDEALALLTAHGDDAKLLAGGHSLIPVMKLRFARPGHLIDIRKVADLTGIRTADGMLVVGAATTHARIERSEIVRGLRPVLAETAALIGDPQIRNMGTIGGSLAHADPAADFPAVMLALGAELRAVGPEGERTIPADEFFQGLMMTSLGPTEILKEVRIPLPGPRTGEAYAKHPHPASRFAVVGVAAEVSLDDDGRIAKAMVGITGLDTRARRARAVEDALHGVEVGDAEAIRAAADRAPEGLSLQADRQGPIEYKEQLARTYTRRAVERALERASAE